jgi:hypothetical protein
MNGSGPRAREQSPSRLSVTQPSADTVLKHRPYPGPTAQCEVSVFRTGLTHRRSLGPTLAPAMTTRLWPLGGHCLAHPYCTANSPHLQYT